MEGNNNYNGNHNFENNMGSTQNSNTENGINSTGENIYTGGVENTGAGIDVATSNVRNTIADATPSSTGTAGADAAVSGTGNAGADAAVSGTGDAGVDAASSSTGNAGVDAASSSTGNAGVDAASSSTGAQGSIYSYSYVNQENQERNPNYYEKREQDNINAGSNDAANWRASLNNAGSNDAANWRASLNNAGSNDAANRRASGSNALGGWENVPGGSNAGQNRAWNGGQGYYSTEPGGQGAFQGQAAASKREKFYKKEKKQKEPRTKKQHGFGMTVAKCASLALVFGLVSSTVFYGTGFAFRKTLGMDQVKQEAPADMANKPVEKKGDSGSLSATNVSTATTVTDVSDIVENVMPSIVSITNMGQQEMDFFGRTFTQDTSSAGSGIIMGQTEDEIYIATNNHVVSNSSQLMVNFIDDQQVQAEIKGTDASTDLAVLSVKVKDIPSDTMEKIKVATVGSSDDIKVGQSAVAIGNALGYGQAVTTGVISAVDREVTIQDEMTGAAITNNLLQTDAAINPGNSGGALLNMNGEVIGINSVKYADTQVEGMGYAIPISAAEPIINNMISREVVDESKSAYLGVTGQDMTSELAESFGIPEGLYITMVKENSAAEQAGIRKGDVLTKFDGRKISSVEGLADIMQYYEAGSQVEITLQKNENGEWREETVTVTLGKKNE